MPITRAMWTHGHAVRIEHPDRLLSVWQAGYYARLIGKPGEAVWIHYAIPTPVIVADNRLSADQAMIRCRTVWENDAWIESVHIFDGEEKIASHNDLHDVAADWSFLRYEIVGSPDIRWGIGLSIKIRFTNMLYIRPEYRNLVEDEINNREELERLLNRGELWVGEGVVEGVVGAPPPGGIGAPGPELHYAIEISSVGCDFGP